MLEIKFVRHNLDILQNALSARGQTADLDSFKTHDDEHRAILQELEALRHRRNVVSDQIAAMKKSGEDAKAVVTQMREVGSKIKELEKTLAGTQETHEAIQIIRSSKVAVTALEGALPAHGDGETICTDGTQLTIQLLKKQLDVVTQPQG